MQNGDDAIATMLLAGGCFWSVELAFQRQPGVIKTAVGYTAGKTKNPSYDAVCSGTTGHTEAVQMTYDPAQVRICEISTNFVCKYARGTPAASMYVCTLNSSAAHCMCGLPMPAVTPNDDNGARGERGGEMLRLGAPSLSSSILPSACLRDGRRWHSMHCATPSSLRSTPPPSTVSVFGTP